MKKKDWELHLENVLIDLDTGVRDLEWTTNHLKTFIRELVSKEKENG